MTYADAFCGYCGVRLPLTSEALKECPSCCTGFKDQRPTILTANTRAKVSHPKPPPSGMNDLAGGTYSNDGLFSRVENVVRPYTERDPTLASLLSVILPGAGQVYNGQFLKGIFIFLTCWLIVPWLFGILDAYVTAKRNNAPVYSGFPPAAGGLYQRS